MNERELRTVTVTWHSGNGIRGCASGAQKLQHSHLQGVLPHI